MKTIVVLEDEVTNAWRMLVAKWLVRSGCLYMMSWGIDASGWDDAVDDSNLEQSDFGEIPDKHFVITTWHENEALSDVFWFAKHSAEHPATEIHDVLVLHISESDRQLEFEDLFRSA